MPLQHPERLSVEKAEISSTVGTAAEKSSEQLSTVDRIKEIKMQHGKLMHFEERDDLFSGRVSDTDSKINDSQANLPLDSLVSANLLMQITELKRELVDTKSDARATVERIKRENKSKNDELLHRQTLIDKLEEELARVQQESIEKSLKDDIKEIKNENEEDLKNSMKIQKLEEDLRLTKAENQSLKAKNSLSESEMGQEVLSYNYNSERITELEELVATLKQEHKESLEKAIREKEEEDRKEHKEKIKRLEDLLDRLQDDNASLQNALASQRQTTNEQHNQKVKELEQMLEHAYEASDRLAARLSTVQYDTVTHNKTTKTLADQVAVSNESLRVITKERDALKDELFTKMIALEEKQVELKQKLQETRDAKAVCESKLAAATAAAAGAVTSSQMAAKEKAFEATLAELVKTHENEWEAAKVANSKLQAQLRAKTEKEHALEQEKNRLALQLAGVENGMTETAGIYGNKIKALKKERDALKESQMVLAQKLVAFAKALDTMTVEQADVANRAMDQEEKVVRAINAQSRLMAEARREQKTLNSLKKKQDELVGSLELIREDMKKTQKDRERFVMRGVEQCRSIQLTQGNRTQLMGSLLDQRTALSSLIQKELRSLPESVTAKCPDLLEIQEHHKSTFKRVNFKAPAIEEVAPVEDTDEAASSEEDDSAESDCESQKSFEDPGWW